VLPYIILGLFAGSIYALAALGIVLTYKTTGVFNFAYGGVAMFCAYVFWQLRDQWHLSQWLVIPILLVVVAPILGLILEAVFRPLATASAEVQIVVALGMLAFFINLVPIIFGGADHQLTSIFSAGHFHWGRHVVVTWNEAGTFLLTMALGAGLYVLLRRTRLGTATRAVVDNRDLAGLIGVNASSVGQAAWIISTGFAALAGILLSTDEGLVTYVLPALVIYAFAPAVLGRLTSLPLAFAGAVALGLLLNILARYSTTGFLAKLEGSIPYLALFVLLVVLGPSLKEVRSSLRPLTGRASTGSPRWQFGGGVVAAVVAAIVLPQELGVSIQHDVAEAMAYSVIALTLVVLTGWTGQISVAQMSFAGVGAFTAAHMAGTHGSLFPLAVVLGVAIAVPLSLLVGLPSLRLTGLFLALATLAFALLMDTLVFADTSISGGLTGLNITAAKIGPLSLKSYTAQFYLCLFVLTVVAAGVFWLKRGPVGRRLQMVRDAPDAAATLGASLTLTKLAVFAAGAAVAAIGGSLLAVTQQTVDPSNFSFNQSLELLLVVVVGGRLLVAGAMIAGGLYLVTLLPLPTWVDKYFPLLIAINVIFLANEPDGTLAVAIRQTRFCLAVLYRRPRPDVLLPVPDVLQPTGTRELSGQHG
jgi:branched-chain amino acid transport system permease protein